MCPCQNAPRGLRRQFRADEGIGGRLSEVDGIDGEKESDDGDDDAERRVEQMGQNRAASEQ